jgi:DNA-directed RNA polymerase subunit beta
VLLERLVNIENRVAWLVETGKKFVDEKKGKELLKKGAVITEADVDAIPLAKWIKVHIAGKAEIADKIEKIKQDFDEQISIIKLVYEEKIDKIKRGDELPPGVIKMVKVSLAVKRKLSVGDKMAGRHGNKGVLSRILPVEDMPYMEDGTPVDIVLNPLGVPSRMNVGQVLETHLGWAARGLGQKVGQMLKEQSSPQKVRTWLRKVYGDKSVSALLDALPDDELLALATKLSKGMHMATPVFDGAREPQINECFDLAEMPHTGQTQLFDGRSGEPFDKEVTVGIIYMLKLHHLVDDKIHARSIGTYSLVTQQPLGGKAQFGGQRLGEMEVWALEAYGAAHTLQELLTLKSDDVYGRSKLYENIVKGELNISPALPESCYLVLNGFKCLCVGVVLIYGEKNKKNK